MLKVDNDWREFLEIEIEKPYFKQLKETLVREYSEHTVFPPKHLIFNAFEQTPLHSIKVVILGQDPYHEFGQAMGMAFSVPKGVKIPPSLVNIYKEIENEYGVKMDRSNGDLTRWAKQGVFLLNTTLTVREGQANSHKDIGWQTFSNNVVREISKQNQPIVFMLWGSFAKSKKEIIEKENGNHLILESVHPSPLSANRGFFGCGHFKRANEFLERNGVKGVNWID